MQVACAHIHTLRTLNQKHRIERDENTTEKGNLTTYHASNINMKINLSLTNILKQLKHIYKHKNKEKIKKIVKSRN